jgi:hypothetical protein
MRNSLTRNKTIMWLLLISVLMSIMNSVEGNANGNHSKTNVLLVSWQGGSQGLNQMEMGKALAEDGFNVTIFCTYDTDIKESRNLHKYSLPFSKDEIFP